MPLESGSEFAGYTILRLLGAGGMGEVYLAEHPRLPRREALKILNSDISAADDYRRRFVREADLAASLWHPNIVRVNDRGEFDGQLWISMDFADGAAAANLLHDRYPVGMPADEVAAIVAAIASALDYVHQNGLLHRDIKPANILLTSGATADAVGLATRRIGVHHTGGDAGASGRARHRRTRRLNQSDGVVDSGFGSHEMDTGCHGLRCVPADYGMRGAMALRLHVDCRGEVTRPELLGEGHQSACDGGACRRYAAGGPQRRSCGAAHQQRGEFVVGTPRLCGARTAPPRGCDQARSPPR